MSLLSPLLPPVGASVFSSGSLQHGKRHVLMNGLIRARGAWHRRCEGASGGDLQASQVPGRMLSPAICRAHCGSGTGRRGSGSPKLFLWQEELDAHALGKLAAAGWRRQRAGVQRAMQRAWQVGPVQQHQPRCATTGAHHVRRQAGRRCARGPVAVLPAVLLSQAWVHRCQACRPAQCGRDRRSAWHTPSCACLGIEAHGGRRHTWGTEGQPSAPDFRAHRSESAPWLMSVGRPAASPM